MNGAQLAMAMQALQVLRLQLGAGAGDGRTGDSGASELAGGMSTGAGAWLGGEAHAALAECADALESAALTALPALGGRELAAVGTALAKEQQQQRRRGGCATPSMADAAPPPALGREYVHAVAAAAPAMRPRDLAQSAAAAAALSLSPPPGWPQRVQQRGGGAHVGNVTAG
eukprot:30820-Chlamydomonas_euryale.AAC.1